jgi:Ca2+-binding RTX toxin-like protein
MTPTIAFAVVPANDDFANPQIIGNGGQGSTSGNTVDASREAGEPAPNGIPGGHSIWYQWTAPATGQATFTTAGSSFDTTLGAYTGSSLGGLSVLAGDDDAGPGLTSEIGFSARAGVTYRIQVDGYYGSAGAVSLSWNVDANAPCTISGTSAGETLRGTGGADVICAGGGNDTILGQGGNDTIIGGSGVDTASYSESPAAVVANLTTGEASGQGEDTLLEVENLVGSRFDDKLDGDAGVNRLNGGFGNDGVWGQTGNDQLQGGDGADLLGGGVGNDNVNGNAGDDTVHFGRAAAVVVDLTAGTSTGEGSDRVIGIENITGSPGADRLRGTGAANRIGGAGGNDVIFGLAGNDQLTGAGGNDTLNGDAGTDNCDGGSGTDKQTGCETRVSIP